MSTNMARHPVNDRAGVVNLGSAAQPAGQERSQLLGARHLRPHAEGPLPEQPVMDGLQQMAAEVKEVPDDAVDRQKPLRLPR